MAVCGAIVARTVLWANGQMMARLNVVNVARVLLVTHGLDAVWAQVSAVRVPVGNTGHLSDLNVLSAHLAAFSHTKEEWCASAALHQNMQRGVLLSCARAVQLGSTLMPKGKACARALLVFKDGIML